MLDPISKIGILNIVNMPTICAQRLLVCLTCAIHGNTVLSTLCIITPQCIGVSPKLLINILSLDSLITIKIVVIDLLSEGVQFYPHISDTSDTELNVVITSCICDVCYHGY